MRYLRGARLHGARLDRALFLTPPQVAAAAGDAHTALPAFIERPGRWASLEDPFLEGTTTSAQSGRNGSDDR